MENDYINNLLNEIAIKDKTLFKKFSMKLA